MFLAEWLDIQHWLTESLLLFIELTFFAILFTFLEKIRPIQPDITLDQEKRTELLFYIINRLFLLPLCIALYLHGVASVLRHWVPYQFWNAEIQSLPLAVQILLGAFILDIGVYIRHRFMHVVLWRVHAIHHSAVHVNWLTSQRLHPVEIAISVFFDMSVLYFIGFSGDGMAYATLLMMAMNLLTHANINLEWPGFLRYCFGSPNFHRWHHAKQEKEAYDKNYCVIFPFIDIALGTFYYPAKKLPKSYGIYQRKGEMPLDSSFIHQMAYPFISRK